MPGGSKPIHKKPNPAEGHMASELQKQELTKKVSTLVGTEFGGDYSLAFQHYGDINGKVGKDGVKALLKDAGIGSVWTRWAWAGALIAELDGDGEVTISLKDLPKGVTVETKDLTLPADKN
jgi:hypothetical protein